MPQLPNGQRFHWYKLGPETVKYIKEVFERMETGDKLKGPDELRRVLGPLGALKPSRQIMVNGDTIEAHAIWPEIFDGLDSGDDNFYMAVPYDYKNEHFIPADGEPLDEETQKQFEYRTGAAWGQKVACIYHRPPMNIDVPEDFDKKKHDYAQGCSVCSTGFKMPDGIKPPKGP